ncbi:hypothetical protein G6F22_017783 [Rhizopus arrhizus]|nr:hypothetical protein G6F22_017783 [Rhizopus arrhizus]
MGHESSATKISTATPSMEFQAFLQGEQEDDGQQGKKDATLVPGEFHAAEVPDAQVQGNFRPFPDAIPAVGDAVPG